MSDAPRFAPPTRPAGTSGRPGPARRRHAAARARRVSTVASVMAFTSITGVLLVANGIGATSVKIATADPSGATATSANPTSSSTSSSTSTSKAKSTPKTTTGKATTTTWAATPTTTPTTTARSIASQATTRAS